MKLGMYCVHIVHLACKELPVRWLARDMGVGSGRQVDVRTGQLFSGLYRCRSRSVSVLTQYLLTSR